jgi:hypothetical protein
MGCLFLILLVSLPVAIIGVVASGILSYIHMQPTARYHALVLTLLGCIAATLFFQRIDKNRGNH